MVVRPADDPMVDDMADIHPMTDSSVASLPPPVVPVSLSDSGTTYDSPTSSPGSPEARVGTDEAESSAGVCRPLGSGQRGLLLGSLVPSVAVSSSALPSEEDAPFILQSMRC